MKKGLPESITGSELNYSSCLAPQIVCMVSCTHIVLFRFSPRESQMAFVQQLISNGHAYQF